MQPSDTDRTRTLAANALSSVLLGLGVPTLVMVVTTKVYLHFLGVRLFGVYAVATSLLAATNILRLGTSDAVVKYVAHYRTTGEQARLAGTVTAALAFYLAVALLGSCCLVAFADFISTRWFGFAPGEHGPGLLVLRVTAATLPASLLLSAASCVFSGYERYDLSTRIGASTAALSAVGGVSAVVSGGGLPGLIIAMSSATWLAALASTVLALRHIGLAHVSPRDALREVRHIFGFSAYSSINTIASSLFTTIDKVAVGALLGPVAVSYYSVAAQVASRTYTITIALTQALLPRFATLRARPSLRPEERPLLRSSFMLSVFFVSGATAVLLGAHRPLLVAWLGPEFAREAAPILLVLTIAYGWLATALVPYYYLNGIGRPRLASAWYLSAAAAQYALIFALTPAYGMRGFLVGSLSFPLMLTGTTIAAFRAACASRIEVVRIGVLTLASATAALAAAGLAATAIAITTSSALLDLAIACAVSGLAIGAFYFAVVWRCPELISDIRYRFFAQRLRVADSEKSM